MPLKILASIYLTIAACEIFAADLCLTMIKRFLTSNLYIRLSSLALFGVSALHYTSEPTRIIWLPQALFRVYLATGLWFLLHPQSVSTLFNKGLLDLSANEQRKVVYSDCALRSILALLLIYSI